MNSALDAKATKNRGRKKVPTSPSAVQAMYLGHARRAKIPKTLSFTTTRHRNPFPGR